MSGYLEGEVEVFLDVSLVAQQLSQTVSQLLQTHTAGPRFNREIPPQNNDVINQCSCIGGENTYDLAQTDFWSLEKEDQTKRTTSPDVSCTVSTWNCPKILGLLKLKSSSSVQVEETQLSVFKFSKLKISRKSEQKPLTVFKIPSRVGSNEQLSPYYPPKTDNSVIIYAHLQLFLCFMDINTTTTTSCE